MKPTDPLVVLDKRTHRAVLRALVAARYPLLGARQARIRKGLVIAADMMLHFCASTSFDASSVVFPIPTARGR